MVDEPTKPVGDDLRSEDHEYNPSIEPKKAKAWLNMLSESEDTFKEWNDHADKIDKLYANLSRLSGQGRDREFQMFWANCEVLKPSIYAKPPVPVVVPKFKDRRPVYQAASEVAERCAVVAFDITHINSVMMHIRDDVALLARGVAWCRYESGGNGGYYDGEKVCVEFKDRHDFLHSISRTWEEVSWVAAASYLTRTEARKRFEKHSGDEYQKAEYRVNKDSKEVGGSDSRERAQFWEIWHKGLRRVLWVAHGCEDILDEDDPHLELTNFFPCPRPAYGTVQRGSLIPVPDVFQYRDQLDELNILTGRIHALADALVVKGFYPAGSPEISEAVQTAIRIKSQGEVLVPISNWAAFGGTKDVIIWLPIDMIATTVTGLVALRKQVIEDIYQVMGLADIMRGQTDPNETLGAQQLKSDYGGKRIKDKQAELVRLSRDLVEITLDIITDKFSKETIIEMSQTELPTNRMVEQKIAEVVHQMQGQQQQVQQLMQNPNVVAMAQKNPQQAQQVAKQAQQLQETAMQTINQLKAKPTIDQVFALLKDMRGKTFVLDIETDSTVMADENAEKQRRTEFVSVLGTLLPQLAQMVAADPNTADFCGELLKFATAPFRAGRSLDGSLDELVELTKQKGAQGKPDPQAALLQSNEKIEMAKIEQKRQADAAQLKVKQDELEQKGVHHANEMENQRRIAWAQIQAKLTAEEGKGNVQAMKMQESGEAARATLMGKQQDMQQAREMHQAKMQETQAKLVEHQQKAQDARNMQQMKMTQPKPQRGGLV